MEKSTTFTINPDNFLKKTWDTIVLAIVFIYTLFIPTKLVFLNYNIIIIESIIFILLITDLFLTFNTGYYCKLNYITDRKCIAKRYLKGWFAVDLISSFPFILIFCMLHEAAAAPALMIFFSLLKLLRLAKIPKIISEIQIRFSINPTIMRLTTFLFGFTLIVHYIALGWIMIGATNKGTPQDIQYLVALYWSVTTVSTIGYGDVTPDKASMLQLIYTILVQIIGVGVFSFIIGNVATLLTNFDVEKAKHLKKLEEVGEFLRIKKIPIEVQTKVKNYYQYLWETRKGISDAEIMNDLPRSLNLEISLNLNRSIIDKVPLFKNSSELFIKEIIHELKLEIFLPGDFIVRQGEFGEKMYFVSAGEVDVIIDDHIVATLTDGSFFGESALLTNQKRNAGVRTRNYCDLYSLSKESFDSLRAKYPDFDAHVKYITELREKDNAKNLH